ncbi:MAG: hypothetical protein ACK58J_09240 [Planctomyces sp.]|jgi:hypothetical protein
MSEAAVGGVVTFDELAASRRDWIQSVLRVWCRRASVKELRKAELEWFDLAGRADAGATLWKWAWERFPEAVHADMPGLNETYELLVELRDGRVLRGYPDARQSIRGQLVLLGRAQEGALQQLPTVQLDDVWGMRRC